MNHLRKVHRVLLAQMKHHTFSLKKKYSPLAAMKTVPWARTNSLRYDCEQIIFRQLRIKGTAFVGKKNWRVPRDKMNSRTIEIVSVHRFTNYYTFSCPYNRWLLLIKKKKLIQLPFKGISFLFAFNYVCPLGLDARAFFWIHSSIT